ncbi:UTRA domain-containing protein [Lonsdalea britannica]|uniref:UTRA domain-containing protein n=1 Tax=Lonsdalea britannica TaxID=1082704 RepID=UPI0026E96529|nr:UTRA domain-containing protein [Lonsdalea britannica]
MQQPSTTVALICQTLLSQIDEGTWRDEVRLPSERTLSEQFSTTRITLREALLQLESQGVIYREPRRGWFISPPRIVYNPLQCSHFHAMVEQQGRRAATEVLEAREMAASDVIGQQLMLPVGAKVYQIRRLRRVDERAVLYVEHYLNPAFFPGILPSDLTQSLTDIYETRYGIRYGRVRFMMLPTPVSPLAASALNVATGSPALFITRINRDQSDRIIDCDHEYWRYDAIHIDVEAV